MQSEPHPKAQGQADSPSHPSYKNVPGLISHGLMCRVNRSIKLSIIDTADQSKSINQ